MQFLAEPEKLPLIALAGSESSIDLLLFVQSLNRPPFHLQFNIDKLVLFDDHGTRRAHQ